MADIYGCPSELLNDPTYILDALRAGIGASNGTLVKEAAHTFDPHGVTAVCLLAESHVSIHTWPETGTAFVDMFTCGATMLPEAGVAMIAKQLHAREVHTTSSQRGVRHAGQIQIPEQKQSIVWVAEHLSPTEINLRAVRRVLASEVTPYQELLVVETPDYHRALVLDGKWQSSTADEYIYHEALVHPVCAVVAAPARVLVLGGAEGATVREVLRWDSIVSVTMIDIDAGVVQACTQHLPGMHRGAFADHRTTLQIADAVTFLKSTEDSWDVIIMDLSDPIPNGPAQNLFTVEGFGYVRDRLMPNGACVVQAGGIGPAVAHNFATVVNTMKQHYRHTVPYWAPIPTYPGAWGFCIGSLCDRLPSPVEIEQVMRHHITERLQFVGDGMIGAMLTLPAYLTEAINATSVVSTAERPITWY
ncbi:MAG TPA: adenosylmethionine decarboxylase [Thermoanaerobaculia bacterium]|nr:adenosylmethionine decarboxylase [Thermoanaerobaculia bacterium]